MSDDEHQYVTSLYVNGLHVEGLEYNDGWKAQACVYTKGGWTVVRSVEMKGLSLEGALKSLSEEIGKELAKP